VAIPIGSFYELESVTAYRVAVPYGDQTLNVSARARVIVL